MSVEIENAVSESLILETAVPKILNIDAQPLGNAVENNIDVQKSKKKKKKKKKKTSMVFNHFYDNVVCLNTKEHKCNCKLQKIQ